MPSRLVGPLTGKACKRTGLRCIAFEVGLLPQPRYYLASLSARGMPAPDKASWSALAHHGFRLISDSAGRVYGDGTVYSSIALRVRLVEELSKPFDSGLGELSFSDSRDFDSKGILILQNIGGSWSIAS
jgi:hypothetical protein